ncbi:MAG: tRNA (adenosine(37)-N6)-threonylcarbamoyltransferase complex ATPase subunit type 1 TsaE [Rikenellaceae bacterium]
MNEKYIVKDVDELDDVAEKMIEQLRNHESSGNIVLFYGEMGAGKTTLIRALCKAAGVEDVVTSPTFAIVNEYATTNDDTIFHFDFYRIETIREVYDLGYEEYFYSGKLCLIEWPSKIEDIIEDIKEELQITTISITVNEKEHRVIELC